MTLNLDKHEIYLPTTITVNQYKDEENFQITNFMRNWK